MHAFFNNEVRMRNSGSKPLQAFEKRGFTASVGLFFAVRKPDVHPNAIRSSEDQTP
jgi:hypothetical protein